MDFNSEARKKTAKRLSIAPKPQGIACPLIQPPGISSSLVPRPAKHKPSLNILPHLGNDTGDPFRRSSETERFLFYHSSFRPYPPTWTLG